MDDRPRDTDDVVIREQFTHIDNVRDVLRAVVPELADGFQFDEADLVPPQHFLSDWRQRESDVIWRIPYRGPDGILPVLVVVLLEHQSRADPRMPLRTLLYTVLYWGSHRTLAELIDAPVGLRPFVPGWQPLFWDLAAHTPEALWSMAGEWMQALAVLRVADGAQDEFKRVLAETLTRIEGLAETAEVRWKELVQFILGWALHHRPTQERDSLIAAAVASQAAAAHQGRVNTMGPTIAKALKAEGALEGELRGCQKTHRMQLEERFGQLPAELLRRITTITDVTRLEVALRQVVRMNTLDELQL